jgi:hypothetical protein
MFIGGQQLEILHPVELGDHLIRDVQQDIRREVLIIQIGRGTKQILTYAEWCLLDQACRGQYRSEGERGRG